MSLADLVDVDQHLLSPKIFSDPDVYRAEGENIFLRSWLYVGHEQQLSGGPGSYITTYMGEDGVIICRDRSNALRAFLNSCPHRGMRLCTADHGKVKRFQCPFHAWTFNLDGDLVALHGFEEGYHGELPLEKWGMIEVPRLETYRGLIFASFDRDIVPLEDYLGDARWHLDAILNRTEQGLRLLPGVFKWTFNANWKTIADNLAGDNAHTQSTHASVTGLSDVEIDFVGLEPGVRSYLTRTDGGHGFIIVSSGDDSGLMPPELFAYRERSKQMASSRLSPEQVNAVDAFHIGTIFPNFSFLNAFGYTVIRVSHPRGPNKTETWTWTLVDAEMPDAVIQQSKAMAMTQIAPSGMIESDDSEMWIRSQEATTAPYRSRFPINYQMGMGRATRDPVRPGLIHSPPTEIGSFGLYERWRDLMSTGAAK
jgi:3-phenylpropionate/trans-cinnamate dioxygenase subunit alpha